MRSWLLIPVLVTLTACVTHVPLSNDYRGPAALPKDIEVPDPGPAVTGVVPSGEGSRDRVGFTVRPLTMAGTATAPAAVDFEYYDIDGGARTPVVVLLPIFNGSLLITRYFARYFASRGWAAVIVNRSRDPLDELGTLGETIRAGLSDYRRVLDWVELQPELDAKRIGVFGISFGAMDAVMLTAVDDRVNALVVAMAGGDLPYVMTHTRYRPVSRAIDQMAEEEGVSRDAVGAEVGGGMLTDPLALAPYVDAKRVLMIMTRTDVIVPFEAQKALRARMGAPESLYLPTGHRTSVFYFPKLRTAAFEFFERRFMLDSSAVARR